MEKFSKPININIKDIIEDIKESKFSADTIDLVEFALNELVYHLNMGHKYEVLQRYTDRLMDTLSSYNNNDIVYSKGDQNGI